MLHKTIKAVTNDIETLSFNTAISRMMEFVNFFTKQNKRPRSVDGSFVLLLSPFAPHIAEELWKLLGSNDSLAYEPWPVYDESLTVDANVEIPVQILGKIRSKIIVPRGTGKDELEALAMADARIVELLDGKTIRKVIVVPDRLVNIVAKLEASRTMHDAKWKASFRRRLLNWFDQHQRDLPWRKNKSATGSGSARSCCNRPKLPPSSITSNRFIKRFPNVRKLAAAQEQEVLKLLGRAGILSPSPSNACGGASDRRATWGKVPA